MRRMDLSISEAVQLLVLRLLPVLGCHCDDDYYRYDDGDDDYHYDDDYYKIDKIDKIDNYRQTTGQ